MLLDLARLSSGREGKRFLALLRSVAPPHIFLLVAAFGDILYLWKTNTISFFSLSLLHNNYITNLIENQVFDALKFILIRPEKSFLTLYFPGFPSCSFRNLPQFIVRCPLHLALRSLLIPLSSSLN